MPTDRSFTTSHTGPTVLDLTQNTGRISISVNPLAKNTTVLVTTEADTGTSADAVTDARFTESGSRLTVNIPTPGGGGGNVVIGGNSVNMSGDSIFVGGGGGRIVVNGVDVTDVVNGGATGTRVTEVVTSIIIPVDSEVLLSTQTATVAVRGELKALDYGGTSGRLDAEVVGELSLSLTSGDARIKNVTRRLEAVLTSGDLAVDRYSGSDGRLTLTSGDATVHATPQSSGRFHIGLTSGDARLTGAGHLDVRKRVTSGRVRVS